MTQFTPHDVQKLLSMGPFSGSDMYIMLATETPETFEAATFGFKGKIIEIKKPEDIALIDDRQAVLISNGDEVFSKPSLQQALLIDREKLRHRNLVVISRQVGYTIDPVMGNQFFHVECLPPILP